VASVGFRPIPAAAHIPLKERLTYSSLYAAIDNWRQFND
jgi:hypothetical protein